MLSLACFTAPLVTGWYGAENVGNLPKVGNLGYHLGGGVEAVIGLKHVRTNMMGKEEFQ